MRVASPRADIPLYLGQLTLATLAYGFFLAALILGPLWTFVPERLGSGAVESLVFLSGFAGALAPFALVGFAAGSVPLWRRVATLPVRRLMGIAAGAALLTVGAAFLDTLVGRGWPPELLGLALLGEVAAIAAGLFTAASHPA